MILSNVVMSIKINEKWLIDSLILSVLVIVFFLYALINEPHETVYVLNSGIDDLIPRIPAFSVIYLAFLPWVFFTVFFAWYKKRDFKQLAYSLIIINLIAYAVYLVFQTRVPREAIVQNDIFSKILQFIYDRDKPYNCFPSLHSAMSASMATYFVIRKSKWAWLSIIFAALIVVSTLFVKQHFIADAISGIILGIVVTSLVFIISIRKNPVD